jgi:tetraacyldisaccharide 4'-kinase
VTIVPDVVGFRRLVQGETRGPLAVAARGALTVASVPYRAAVSLRNWTFDHRWKRIYRVERPVISIGNITLGGTGKTPFVEWVARWFRNRGARVTLVSRGYKGQGGLNDEGLVLDQNLPDAPHLQDPDRVRSARIAIDELDAQVIILDDGFQHRRLARDLDIVLIDALDPFGGGRLFPRGLLREPTRNLRRAHAVVLSRSNLVDETRRAQIRAQIQAYAPNAAYAEAVTLPRDLVDSDGASQTLSELAGQRVAAFCGIGNPDGFWRTLATLGVEPVALRSFPDHHAYTRQDVEALQRWSSDARAQLVLTTQKDLVKVRLPQLAAVPLRALRIGVEFTMGQDTIDAQLAHICERIAL